MLERLYYLARKEVHHVTFTYLFFTTVVSRRNGRGFRYSGSKRKEVPMIAKNDMLISNI